MRSLRFQRSSRYERYSRHSSRAAGIGSIAVSALLLLSAASCGRETSSPMGSATSSPASVLAMDIGAGGGALSRAAELATVLSPEERQLFSDYLGRLEHLHGHTVPAKRTVGEAIELSRRFDSDTKAALESRAAFAARARHEALRSAISMQIVRTDPDSSARLDYLDYRIEPEEGSVTFALKNNSPLEIVELTGLYRSIDERKDATVSEKRIEIPARIAPGKTATFEVKRPDGYKSGAQKWAVLTDWKTLKIRFSDGTQWEREMDRDGDGGAGISVPHASVPLDPPNPARYL